MRQITPLSCLIRKLVRRPWFGEFDRYRTRTDRQRDLPLPVASVNGKCGIEMLHRSPATGTHFRVRRPQRCSCQEIRDDMLQIIAAVAFLGITRTVGNYRTL